MFLRILPGIPSGIVPKIWDPLRDSSEIAFSRVTLGIYPRISSEMYPGFSSRFRTEIPSKITHRSSLIDFFRNSVFSGFLPVFLLGISYEIRSMFLKGFFLGFLPWIPSLISIENQLMVSHGIPL